MNHKKDVKGDLPREEPAASPAPDEESLADRAVSKPSQAAAPEADNPPDLAVAYQKVVDEKRELYDRLLRKQAEMDNFRKRVQREKEDFLQLTNADLIRALLPVVDGFERALRHRDAGVPKSFYEGTELIHQELLGVLGRAGVTPIETAGKLFDPHLHQAVETVEAKGHRDQEIVEELQRGYKLKNRLLRPAIVKVAAGEKKEGVPEKK
ncbi:MAG: nucleotide exchange factor GrpE [Terriglobia bacterium]